MSETHFLTSSNQLFRANIFNTTNSYIYCSILECDKAESVEHFWHKKLGEDYLVSKGVPFIALRPGAFLDQTQDFLGSAIKRNAWYALSMWEKSVRTYPCCAL